MKHNIYPSLAATGIKKNSRLYIPYIITCVMMISVFYIISFLSYSPAILKMRGGQSTQMILKFGTIVIGIFSLIFLFYTSSIIIKRRKKEFGLYNILGMSRHHLGRILLWETIIISLSTIIIGLAIGIALSKLSELILLNLGHGDVNPGFSVDTISIGLTTAVFSGVFLLILLNSLRQIRFTETVDLLKSSNTGERPPKANWVLGLLGAIVLIAAYYLAVTIKDPVSAIGGFFIAVVMVIVATYMILISGSVAVCTILKHNKKYYYRKDHFISVSSMAFRMKRNGAGLASICILLTMFLVALSSSACLYFGAEDCIKSQYSHDINTSVKSYNLYSNQKEVVQSLEETVDSICSKHNINKKDIVCFYQYYTAAPFQNNTIRLDLNPGTTNTDLSEIAEVIFIDLNSYNRMFNKNIELNSNEVIAFANKETLAEPTINFALPESVSIQFQIADRRELSEVHSNTTALSLAQTIVLVVNDLDTKINDFKISDLNREQIMFSWTYNFNTDAPYESQIQIQKEISHALYNTYQNLTGTAPYTSMCQAREEARSDFYGTFSGLFFIGILLSLVFMVSAVLIIYYKQISEGYEDRDRFTIMQKIGLTQSDIKKTINSQMLTVFLMPILGAGVHTAFAFPFLNELLLLFGFTNTKLLAGVTAICFAACAIIYMLFYKLTSNTYYGIVSTGNRPSTTR